MKSEYLLHSYPAQKAGAAKSLDTGAVQSTGLAKVSTFRILSAHPPQTRISHPLCCESSGQPNLRKLKPILVTIQTNPNHNIPLEKESR